MKPSNRILQISKELNAKDPLYVMMGGDIFIRSQAILDYLDEEYEFAEKSRQELMRNIKPMD